MQPRISVVIPTHDRLAYLSEALDSVLQQTLPPSEVIVVDDGSTDGTAETVGKMPPPVRYFYQKNSGPAAARNRGLREATGEWIAFNDSDDLWTLDKLASQMEFLERNPHVDFLFGHMCNFWPGGETSEPEILDPDVIDYCRNHANRLSEFESCLLKINPVPTPTVIFRRSKLAAVGVFREDLRCAEDYEWWFRWAHQTNCGFLDKVVLKRRLHGANIITDRRMMLQSALTVLSTLEDNRPDWPKSQHRELYRAINQQKWRLACEYYRLNDIDAAAKMLYEIDPIALRQPIDALKWCAKRALTIAKRRFNRAYTVK